MLESEIYVIGTSADEGPDVIAAGASLSLMVLERTDGTKAIPFFSSMKALAQVLEERQGYLRMSARALFEMTRGEMLILNPGSEHGKEFSPNEVASLLENGLNRVPEERHVSHDAFLFPQPTPLDVSCHQYASPRPVNLGSYDENTLAPPQKIFSGCPKTHSAKRWVLGS